VIFYDVTKSAGTGHRSGLMRVNARLGEELGGAVTPVEWGTWDRSLGPGDWFLTTELFSEAERPGLGEFLRRHPGRTAAIFFDAIPLKHPAITWPQSVARHPGYLKLLAGFARIWAISAASRDELLGIWQWMGLAPTPPVEVLTLGADFNRRPRVARSASPTGTPVLLSIGILEPRKNQLFLLEVAEELWAEGSQFELHLVGRTNPRFSGPTLQRIKELGRRRPLHYHAAASDAEVAGLYARARASVFPTRAEGCGLPVLESLWMGVPCVCSDLPVLLENTSGGGCLPLPLQDRAAWKAGLKRILTEDGLGRHLEGAAATRPLPTWAEAAQSLRRGLTGA